MKTATFALALTVGLPLALAAPAGLGELQSASPSAVREAFITARCRLIPFDSVYFEDGGRRRGIIMSIGGRRPNTGLDVILEHYPEKNGNWTIEVTGCRPNIITFPLPTPYVMEIPLRQMPGARRVKIVGQNGVVYRRLPGR